MTAKQKAPCGTWPSALDAETVASSGIRIAGLWVDGADLFWTESRPSEQGRLALLRRRGNGPIEEIVPAPFSVRTRVHEYGGGAFTAASDLVIFCNDADQRLYRLDPAHADPVALTAPGSLRYADLQIDLRHRRVICVAERAREGAEPENFLAGVSLETGEVKPLVRGADFYAFPRLHPNGERLAFLAWNHPAMPWDTCELHLAELGTDGSPAAPVKVAGGAGEAIFAPSWAPSGELTFASDRSGFSNLYRLDRHGRTTCMHAALADFAAPLWVFGLSTHAWLDVATAVCIFQQSGLWRLATLDVAAGRLDVVETQLTELGPIFAAQGRAAFVGGSASESSALYSFDPDTREVRLIRRPVACPMSPGAIAHPQPFDFTTAGDRVAHGLLYLPQHPVCEPLAGELPPLLVICHGGPTGSASTAFNPSIQFWTSRGFAILDVNYRGSTGYGRAYRKMLDGQWGIADVEDCVSGAVALAKQGLVDGDRMAIRGSSAGGYTVLCALAFHDVFAAGASYYGVCDLEALATDTHKFESRYLDSLVGPYPARRDLYRARSPLHAADRMSCPVIFFHGQQDRVVPVAQAEAMATALRRRGLAAPLMLFPDEQHGFRRRETIQATLTAELAFYREIFAIPC